MPDWAPSVGCRCQAANSASGGISVANSTTANVKAAWVELLAATDFDVSRIVIIGSLGSLTTYLMDVGVGPTDPPQILIPDIHASCTNLSPFMAEFPLNIPAGSRLWGRISSATTSTSISTNLLLIGEGSNGPSPMSRVLTYGAVAASSKGTVMDPGATLNTKGVWVALTTSTDMDSKALVVDFGNNNNAVATGATWLIDVGIGAAGQEQVLVPNFRITASINETIAPQITPVIPASIPAGSQLSVRCQSNLTDATDRLVSVVAHIIG